MNILIIVISILISNAPVQDSGFQTVGYNVGNQETGIEINFGVSKQSEWSALSWNSQLYIFSEPLDLWQVVTLDSFEDGSYSVGSDFKG